MHFNRRKTKVLLCALQVLLAVLIFTPAGGQGGADKVIDICRLYESAGYGSDAKVYLFLALSIPLAVVLSLFLMKERRNFGLGACLGALLTLVHTVFYSAVKISSSIPLSASIKARFFFLILLGLFTMGAEIYGYMFIGVQSGQKGQK